MCGLWPKCNEWRNCKRMMYNVQRWVNKCSWWWAKWLAIYSEWSSCSEWWAKNWWKMALHNFRICEFPQILCTVLCEIITVRLGYHKICATWVVKKAHGCTQNRVRLERYHKDGNRFLSHTVRVTVMKSAFHFRIMKPRSNQNTECTHIHQTSWRSLYVGLSENWWKLFSGTERKCWWWNSCNNGP
jgi:hypothetical protein